MIALAEKKKISVLLIQEPYWHGGIRLFNNNYHLIHKADAVNRTKALIAVDKRFAQFKPIQLAEYTDSQMASMEFKLNGDSVIMTSIYMNGRNQDGSTRDISGDLVKLGRLIDKAERENKCLIIATDSNAKSSVWGDKSNNCKRGQALLEFISANDLTVHNDRTAGPTFVNYKKKDGKTAFGSSCIDLTMSANMRSQCIERWTCDQDSFVLDHKLIEFEISEEAQPVLTEFQLQTQKHNLKKANWPLFVQTFDEQKPIIKDEDYTNDELEVLSESLVKAIQIALDKAAPKLKCKQSSQPWYSERLAQAKAEIDRLRKTINKKKKKRTGDEQVGQLLDRLRDLNREYGRLTRSAKQLYFGELNRVNGISDLWKVLKKAKSVRGESFTSFTKASGEVTDDADEIDDELLCHFVPENKECQQEMKNRPIAKNGRLKPLGQGELRSTMRGSLNKKAPGPDGIGNQPVKILFDWFEPYFERFYSLLLANIYMPRVLKKGRLIFFQKPGRSQNCAKGLRPITLLPVLGKVLEQLLISRINDELNRRSFISPTQHGFTKSKSTDSAIEELKKKMKGIKKRKVKYAIILALDISSAFDRINWNHLIRNLQKAGCEGCFAEAARQLLTDREILYDDGKRNRKRTTNIGVPQGGRASPGLWNLGMTDLLLNLTKNKIFNIAFADDLAVVLEARSLKELRKKFETATKVIENWCRGAELKLSAEKSQLLSLGKFSIDQNALQIDGKSVPICDKLKYLGVILDSDLKWNEHLNYMEERAAKVIQVIHKMNWMSRKMRLKEKRIIYMQVALPTIGYAHRQWFPDLRYDYQKKRLTRIQRRIILAITRCYRTTSNKKIQQLLGVLDLNEELRHRIEHKESDKLDARKAYDEKCEEKNKLHQEIELTDSKELLWFLSNHGPHRTYLKRFGLSDVETCRLCGTRSAETVEHLTRDCESTAPFMPSDLNDLTGICRAVEQIVSELRKRDRIEESAKNDRSFNRLSQ